MNSIHDLGGMHGMGPLPFEKDEPVFHQEWERSAFGVNILLQLSGMFNADESRHSMEKITALRWLESPYYLHWADGYESMLVEKGYLTKEEIAAGKALEPEKAMPELSYIEPSQIPDLAKKIHEVTGKPTGAAEFEVGDKVRAKNWNPKTHTRLPRYIRGKVGTVMARPDAFVYADSRAHGGGDNPQHTYSVRFEGKELWGPDAGPRDAVYIDLYETYIEAL